MRCEKGGRPLHCPAGDPRTLLLGTAPAPAEREWRRLDGCSTRSVHEVTTMTAGGRFARNVLSSYGLRGLRAVSVLLLTPYLFRQLGLDGFGTWSVVFTIATVFSLVEYGA